MNENSQAVATDRITQKRKQVAYELQFRGPQRYQALLNTWLDITRQHGLQDVSMQYDPQGVDYF